MTIESMTNTTTTDSERAPLVAVITPAYNVEQYIEEAIASVLSQTFRQFEYVIVDDGSTDATVQRAQHMTERDPRVRIVHSDHGGSAAARNAGIAATTAPFIAFLDGDDRWTPRFLERLHECLETSPPETAAVFAHSQVIDEDGNVAQYRVDRAHGSYDLARILSNNCPPGNGSSLLLRRECFEEAGGFDTRMQSSIDHEMWLRICATNSARRFVCVPELLVEYRQRRGSISTNTGARALAYTELFKRYGDRCTSAELAAAKLSPALIASRSGNRSLARRWFLEIARARPTLLINNESGRRLSGRVIGAHAVVTRVRKARARAAV